MAYGPGKSLLFQTALNLCLRLFFPLVLASPLSAAPVSLEAEIGFHGLFQLGRPFPLRVDLRNLGPPVDGALEVKVGKGGPARGTEPYLFYYRREVFLSSGAQKSVWFTVDPDSMSRPLTVSFSAPGVELAKEIDLRGHFSPFPLILLLTENAASPTIPLASASSQPLIRLSLGDLSSDPRAYHGISAIIFYEQSLRDLSRGQAKALETWLASGGILLVLGSMHYALYQDPAWSRFLPVQVSGLRKLSSLPSLERRYGIAVSRVGDLWAQDSKLVHGRALWEEKGTPVLVEMTRGRGKVLYFSLDVGRPPLSAWNGLPSLFRDLLGPPPEKASSWDTVWDETVFSQLLFNPSFIAVYLPLGSFLLWIMVYFGGLGFLVWLWHQKRLPCRLIVMSLIFWIFLSSFGGYFHFDRGGNVPDGVLLSSTLLDSLPDGYVEVQSNIALFSTQKRHHKLRVESGWSDVEPVIRRLRKSEDSGFVIEDDEDSTGFRLLLREWDYRLFKVRSVARFPVAAELQQERDKFSLKLVNRSAYDLTECWFVLPGQRYFVGDIPRGSSQIREFPVLAKGYQADSRQTPTDLWQISFGDKARELLFRYSFFPQDRGMTRWGSGAALFLGWVRDPPRRVWVEDARILPYGYALFRAVFPLDGGEEE